MITEDYVSFETAKLLKEKGFYSPYCYYYYFPDIESKTPCVTDRVIDVNEDKYLAPTYQMAMKWLREVHKIFIEVGYNRFYGTYNVHVFNMVEQQDDPYKLPARFNNYKEACEAAIKYCLENLI